MTTVVDYPWRGPFLPSNFEFGGTSNATVVRSVLSGAIQTATAPGKRWRVGMTLPNCTPATRAEVEGFFDSLDGQSTRVRLWHMGRVGLTGHGTPMGTINTAGVTVKTDAAQFAASIVLTGCGNAKTLAAGDMLSINGQLLMNPVLATSTAGGDISLPVSGMLRAAAAAGTPVLLVKPFALFILANPDWRANYRAGGYSSEFGVDWEEVFP